MTNQDKRAEESSRAAMARHLCALISSGSYDEVRVMMWIGARIFGRGRDTYGPLEIKRDARDWRRETSDELADAVFYVACDWLAREDARLDGLRTAAAQEMARLEIDAANIAREFDAAPTVARSPSTQLLDADISEAFRRIREDR